jgi:PKD repeat protein
VNYGDGSDEQTLALSGKAFTLNHRYVDNGKYTVTVTVNDHDGGAGTDTLDVTVKNVAPTAGISNNGPVNEAGTATVTLEHAADASPVDAAALRYFFSTDQTARDAANYAAGSTSSSQAFSFNDNGDQTVYARVIDKDGGHSDYETVVHVNNVIPVVAEGADATINEGGTFAGGGTFTDPGADTWTATVDYGDGSGLQPLTLSGKSFALSHTYRDNGKYTVTVTVKDDDGGVGADTLDVTVNNVAPTPSIVSVSTPRVEGTAVSVVGSATDPAGANDTLTYAWAVYKDGTTTAYATGGNSTGFTFTPNDNGSYRIELTVSDEDGGSATVSQSITVANADPVATVIGAPATSPEGTAIHLSGSVTDAGSADTHTFAWAVTKNGVAYGAGTGTAFSFTPDDNGSYVVSLTVTDDDGGVGTDTRTIAVTNVAPTPSIASISSVRVEGTAINVSGSATDAGSSDAPTLAWQVFKNGVATPYASGTGANFQFTPNDNGSYRIALTATDKDGSSTTVDQTITVANANPENLAITVPGAAKLEGSSITVTGSATDPAGANDTLTYAWSVKKNGSLYTTGTGQSFTFTPDDNGAYSVTLTVSDEDGGAASTTAADIAVANVAPSVSLSGDATGVRGQSRSFTATFTDPGADTWDAVVSFGDGTSQTFTNVGKTFTFGHVYTASGTYVVNVTVSDDDGGAGSANNGAGILIKAVEIQGGDLVVGGTSGNDTISFNKMSSGIIVSVNGAMLGTFAVPASGRLIAYGQAGDDTMQGTPLTTLPMELYGDAGNDRLVGGAGPSLLVGGDGNDNITGGSGRSVQVGGAGADTLSGAAADDLLIGDDYVGTQQSLRSILTRWADTSVAATYAARTDSIRPDLVASVRDDLAVDVLTGNGGTDWFFSKGSTINDTIKDRTAPEVVN